VKSYPHCGQDLRPKALHCGQRRGPRIRLGRPPSLPLAREASAFASERTLPPLRPRETAARFLAVMAQLSNVPHGCRQSFGNVSQGLYDERRRRPMRQIGAVSLDIVGPLSEAVCVNHIYTQAGGVTADVIAVPLWAFVFRPHQRAKYAHSSALCVEHEPTVGW
jgi:hypothetical protein